MGWDSDVRSAYSWFSNAIDAFGLLVVCSAQKTIAAPGTWPAQRQTAGYNSNSKSIVANSHDLVKPVARRRALKAVQGWFLGIRGNK
jgi:hypothetical protein